TIEHIAAEVIARVPLVRQQDRQQLLALKKWGWLVPFSGVRRAFLGFLLSRLWFRRQGIGTFQISCLATVDRFMPFLFSTTAILGFGCVKDKVIAIDGQPVVRPMVTVSCCADHKVCDGVKMAQFLVELKALLESGNLESLG
ncbi:MAG: 2-oxo acid dehydrogenase subunit E2, partial [Cyanobacteria bacterium J06648_11]